MKVFIVEPKEGAGADGYMYDAYDSHVVVAEDEQEALNIGFKTNCGDRWVKSIDQLQAVEIDYSKSGVVHSSFNAG